MIVVQFVFMPLFSKILEHLVIDQLDLFLEDNHLINECQSGFRKQYSTTMALIKISGDIRFAKGNHEITFLILLVFSKAFKSIDYDILPSTMIKYFNFSNRAVSFFISFLQNRWQATILNGIKSQLLKLEGGVPQGTVYGPKIFSLFINDLP
jgi:hypothetical protein